MRSRFNYLLSPCKNLSTMLPSSTLTRIFVLSGLGALLVVPGWAALAFPGAEGFGRHTAGGRGGRVVAVTNLNDGGPGGFRAAVHAVGPGTVVFQVGGVIRLESPCDITQPFLTIVGQTAPGDGILFTGAAINIRTSEVIVRNIRRRYDGDAPAVDGIGIVAGGDEVRNVILDHCSISWGKSGTPRSGIQRSAALSKRAPPRDD